MLDKNFMLKLLVWCYLYTFRYLSVIRYNCKSRIMLKILWNCYGNFLIFRCENVVKTSKLKKKKSNVWCLVVLWQTSNNIGQTVPRHYLTSVRALPDVKQCCFLAPSSTKIDVCSFLSRRWITSALYVPDIKWHLIYFSTLFRKYRTLKVFFVVVYMKIFLVF